jgi:cyclopropane fatty-acyl-phospholipid synthase-like methyltransferase
VFAYYLFFNHLDGKNNLFHLYHKAMAATTTVLKADRIMQVGLGFWASKTLLSAVKLGLFTLLAPKPLTAEEVKTQLGLNQQGLYVRDFLDALVSMHFLERQGEGDGARYGNTPETGTFLDKNKPDEYRGGFLEMANDREYRFWGDLEEGLRTGQPQNEIKTTGQDSFSAIYNSPEALRNFAHAMAALQKENFAAFVKGFDMSPFRTLKDFGGSSGAFAIAAARQYPHLQCTTYDLPGLIPVARESIAAAGVEDRVQADSIDFFQEPLPGADLISMNNILNSFALPIKNMLIGKAYQALPGGGAFVVIENFLDNDRRSNTFGLLMSLNMLIESDGGYCHTEGEFAGMLRQAGFSQVKFLPINEHTSAAIAYK